MNLEVGEAGAASLASLSKQSQVILCIPSRGLSMLANWASSQLGGLQRFGLLMWWMNASKVRIPLDQADSSIIIYGLASEITQPSFYPVLSVIAKPEALIDGRMSRSHYIRKIYHTGK